MEHSPALGDRAWAAKKLCSTLAATAEEGVITPPFAGACRSALLFDRVVFSLESCR